MISKLEQEKSKLKQQVEHLNSELLKTKTELSTCQASFNEHKQKSRKRIDSYLDEIVNLEFITTIQKFTLKPSPKGYSFAIGDNKPRFLNSALKDNTKLYSVEQLLDDSIVRVVVHDCEEEEHEDESR